MVNAKEWFDEWYPKEERKLITWLELRRKGFQEELDLSDFVNLEELNCSDNKLTSLNLSECSKLKTINCSENQLTNLDVSNCSYLVKLSCNNNKLINLILPKDCNKLKELRLHNNNFNKDLSFLSGAVNLEYLESGNNKFYGSLEYLKELKKLKTLYIGKTNINMGLHYVPESVTDFGCSVGNNDKIWLISDLLSRTPGNNFTQKLKNYKEKVYKLLKEEADASEQKITELEKGPQVEKEVSQLQQKAESSDAKFPVISHSDEKQEIKNFLNSYIEMLKLRVKDCEEVIKSQDFSQKEKQPYQEEKQEYEAKIIQVQPFITKIDNWGGKG